MFFKSIEPHLIGMNLNLVITKSETGLVVSVLPQLTCKDEAKKNITPILLKGTAEELDAQFAGIIQEPLQKVSGLSVSLIQFEESVEKAEAENAIAKAGKLEEKKLTDKADKFLKEADEFIKAKEIDKAVLKIEGALKFAPNYKKALDLLKKHKPEATPDIFAEVIEEVKVVPTDVTTDEAKVEMKIKAEEVKEALPPNSLQEVNPNTGENIGEPIVLDVEPALPPVQDEPQVPMEATPVVPEAIQEIADASPNVEIVSIPKALEQLAETGEPVKIDEANTLVQTNQGPALATPEKEVSQADKNNQPVSLKGTPKPRRMDNEPMEEFEIRVAAWKVYNPEVAEVPAATKPSATPIEEVKSPMQEMAEEDMASRAAAFEAEKVVQPEVKEEPKSSSNDNIEILG